MSSQNRTAKSATSDHKKADDVDAALSCSEDKERAKPTEILDNQVHEGADSGFLSGPQSSFLGESEEHRAVSAENCNKLNSNPSDSSEISQLHQHKKIIEDEIVVADSGCIEEEEVGEYDEPSYTNAKVELQSTAQEHTETPQKNNTFSTIDASNNMKLKHNVDDHIAERFCNLSLENGPLNNLDSPSRVATVEPVTTTTTTTTKTTSESNQLPAWEQFYQQNDEGDTYLHLACISGQENVVTALIRLAIHPCLLNIKNDYGQTPLHLAALTKQRRILRTLLLAGAEPSIRDRHGNTALHLACMSGDEQCVNALTVPFSASEINEAHRQFGFRSNDKLVSSLSYACLPPDLEIRNYNGEYCVHIAAETGNINILSILVQNGADVNEKEAKGGYTPLHIAIEKGNEELFNYLLDDCKQKLDLETMSFGQLTAYQFACILGRSQMQSSLENRGAVPITPPESEYESSDDDSDLEESKNYERCIKPGYFGGNAMAVM